MFIKWPSIENSYRTKFIQKAVEEHPDLATCTYEITEKLHGANVQFHFEPGEEMRVATRSRYLEPGSKFYDIWNILPKYQQVWDEILDWVDCYTVSIRLFGELYGQGIQKGVYYKPRKKIGFFGVMVDSNLLYPSWLRGFAINRGGLEDSLVPRVDLVDGLEAALAVGTNFPTTINPIEGNICEGVVIQPYHKVYRLSNGSTFLLKKKNEAFKEKQKARKPPIPVDSETLRLHAMFETYITGNRLNNVFSNWGCIEEPQQIGEYIRLVIADALEDFIKDHGAAWNVATRQQQGQITKVGGTIAGMLKGYL